MARSSKKNRRARKEHTAKAAKAAKSAAVADAPSKWSLSRDSFFPFRGASSSALSAFCEFGTNRCRPFMTRAAGATLACAAALFYAVLYAERALALRTLVKSWVRLPPTIPQLLLVVLSLAVLTWLLPPIIPVPTLSAQEAKKTDHVEEQQQPSMKRTRQGSHSDSNTKSKQSAPVAETHEDQQHKCGEEVADDEMQARRQEPFPPPWQ